MESKRQNLFDRVFRTSDGKAVIWQSPNAAIISWFFASLMHQILPDGRLHAGAGWLAFCSIFLWASFELFDGVNLFRQALGMFVLFGIVAIKMRRL